MKKWIFDLKKWQLALLAAVMLILAWPPLPTFFFSFFGITILLILHQKTENDKNKAFFGYFFLAHLAWNIGTTWWVYKASLSGAIFMLLANSALQVLPWASFRFAKKVVSPKRALAILVCFYIGFEYFHHLWDLSWPWLTLGNCLSAAIAFAQFYDITGTAGGSLWILVTGIALFQYLKGKSWRPAAILALAPALYSLFIFFFISFKGEEAVKVGLVQPNFEPLNEKFNIAPEVQLDTMLRQMESLAKQGAKLMVLPETALVAGIDESNAMQSYEFYTLKTFIEKHPGVAIIGGCDSYRIYADKQTSTTRQSSSDTSLYFDVFNTAFYLDSGSLQPLYHKAKLVPGTEIMPYPGLLSFLDNVMISLDGTPNSLGRDFRVFNYQHQTNVSLAPSICYESIYGDWTSKFVKKGANLIVIMSNDGWWGQTYGYQQLLAYGKLRAIENRRWIARSGNTGISGVINPKGVLSNNTLFWERAEVTATVYTRNKLTVFTKLGDYLNRSFLLVSLFLIPSLIVKRILLKN